jgi:uncharacterized protein
MLLDLTRYRRPLEHFSRTFAPEQVAQTDDAYRILVPVELDFDIHKDREKFRLEGTARTELELSCGRCLEPFSLPVDQAFDLRYQPHAHNSGEGEREIEEDDLTTAFYENDEIDLGQLMREQFYLALPMKPLCSDACQGLCPICGTNLNRGTCDCNRQWEDPRLAALKTLRRES